MALSEYVGRTPGADSDRTVEHVTHHRRWSPERTVFGSCPQCDGEFDLSERHVLVTLGSDADAEADRRYFCSESCLADWMDGPA
ncbi:MAG: hypothetical protein ABEH83_13605 [Halobacterium sp.]